MLKRSSGTTPCRLEIEHSKRRGVESPCSEIELRTESENGEPILVGLLAAGLPCAASFAGCHEHFGPFLQQSRDDRGAPLRRRGGSRTYSLI